MAFAVRLPNTGGWPNTPHRVIDPVPGSRRVLIANLTPGELVPIDERGIPLEEARRWHDDPGNPLELVQIDKNGKEIHHKAAEAETADAEKGKD